MQNSQIIDMQELKTVPTICCLFQLVIDVCIYVCVGSPCHPHAFAGSTCYLVQKGSSKTNIYPVANIGGV